jgi:hypothetical protein
MSTIVNKTLPLRTPRFFVPELARWLRTSAVDLFHGFRLGLAIMDRYHDLAGLSKAELKRDGISPEQISWLAVRAAQGD